MIERVFKNGAPVARHRSQSDIPAGVLIALKIHIEVTKFRVYLTSVFSTA